MGFSNPVIAGFHPDPSICRLGDDYFLVTSSFTYFPGVPIFRSRNLVDWTQVGHVLSRPSQLDLSTTDDWSSLGVFAPTIRHHAGRFWMITTVFGRLGAKNFFVTAVDPSGPWSDPVTLDITGIDPDLCWDDDDSCWVHYSEDGINRCRIDVATGALLHGPESTWSGTGLQHPEAPHLFRRGDSWYLLVAEGGTERGHAISIARAPSPTGPWEPNAANPILSHRSTDAPIQNIGHADMVEALDGSWWLVALGVRPRGITPSFHVLGRETFLAPIEWVDDWPVVGPVVSEMHQDPPGPRELAVYDARDDFDDPEMHPRWITVRRPAADFASLTTNAGRLTVEGTAATLDSGRPAFVGRRQQHHLCRARTVVDAGPGVEGGLAVVYDDRAHYEIGVLDDRVIVRARIGPLQSQVAGAPRPPGPVILCAETVPHPFGPDAICLGFEADDGELTTLAELDGRYLSTEVAGGFIGRVIGMYAVGGSASFDWFEYQPLG